MKVCCAQNVQFIEKLWNNFIRSFCEVLSSSLVYTPRLLVQYKACSANTFVNSKFTNIKLLQKGLLISQDNLTIWLENGLFAPAWSEWCCKVAPNDMGIDLHRVAKSLHLAKYMQFIFFFWNYMNLHIRKELRFETWT